MPAPWVQFIVILTVGKNLITRTYANHGFLTLCRSFFAQRGKKGPTEEVKYHAAAGYNRLWVRSKME
jgi:hypothetical protein